MRRTMFGWSRRAMTCASATNDSVAYPPTSVAARSFFTATRRLKFRGPDSSASHTSPIAPFPSRRIKRNLPAYAVGWGFGWVTRGLRVYPGEARSGPLSWSRLRQDGGPDRGRLGRGVEPRHVQL